MAEKFIISGIEKLRIGPGTTTSTVPTEGMIDVSDYITPNSLVRTKNADSVERLVPDGKSQAYVTYKTPGEPDTISVSLIDQNPELEQLLTNVDYTAATTTIIELADRKLANICIEITTGLQDGKKCVIFIPTIAATTGTVDPITFNNTEKFVINGQLQTFKHSGKDAISIKKWVTAAGATIDSTPPTPPSGT